MAHRLREALAWTNSFKNGELRITGGYERAREGNWLAGSLSRRRIPMLGHPAGVTGIERGRHEKGTVQLRLGCRGTATKSQRSVARSGCWRQGHGTHQDGHHRDQRQGGR